MKRIESTKVGDYCRPAEKSEPFPMGQLPINLFKQIMGQCDLSTLCASRGACKFFNKTIEKDLFHKWHPVVEGELPGKYPKLEFWNEGKFCAVSVTDGLTGTMHLHTVGKKEVKLPTVAHYRIPFAELPESGGAIVRGSASKHSLNKILVWHPTIQYPPVELQNWGAGAVALSKDTFISFDFKGHAIEWQLGRDEEREEEVVVKKSEMRFFTEGRELKSLLKIKHVGKQILLGCSFISSKDDRIEWISFDPQTKHFSDPLTSTQLSVIEATSKSVQIKDFDSKGGLDLFKKMKGLKRGETIRWTAWVQDRVYVVVANTKKGNEKRTPYRVLCNQKLTK